jgi:hypothetical protein
MRTVAVVISLALCAGLARAQEQLPQEHAQKAAQLVAAEAAKLTDAQLKTDVDTDKPFGLKKGERAGLVIPDRKLSAEQLGKAGKEVVPVGQLWMKALTPVVGGNATPADRLRLMTVKANDQDHELVLLLLGARKGADGKLQLLVYAKEKEPLLSLPLEAMDRTQEQPKYQAKLPLAALAP